LAIANLDVDSVNEDDAKGYRGHYQRVKMAVAPLRRGLPIDTPRERPPSPRQVARWITTAPSRRGLHAAEALGRLLEHCPKLDRTPRRRRRRWTGPTPPADGATPHAGTAPAPTSPPPTSPT